MKYRMYHFFISRNTQLHSSSLIYRTIHYFIAIIFIYYMKYRIYYFWLFRNICDSESQQRH